MESQVGLSSPLELCQHVPKLLDGFHVFIQEVIVKEVDSVGIVLLRRFIMKFKKTLECKVLTDNIINGVDKVKKSAVTYPSHYMY